MFSMNLAKGRRGVDAWIGFPGLYPRKVATKTPPYLNITVQLCGVQREELYLWPLSCLAPKCSNPCTKMRFPPGFPEMPRPALPRVWSLLCLLWVLMPSGWEWRQSQPRMDLPPSLCHLERWEGFLLRSTTTAFPPGEPRASFPNIVLPLWAVTNTCLCFLLQWWF